MKFRPRGLPRYSGKRHRPGEMNQTEAKYAAELQLRKLAGEIHDWRFECETFKLADGCRFTPDFAVIHLDGSKEFIGVKGGGPVADDALVKIKAAAEKFYEYRWTMAKQQPQRDGGGWKIREF